MSVTLTLILIHTNANAWHENLGIENNKAAELYQTKPNDPAIVQWKNALQLAINDADECFDTESAIRCQTLITTITSNCEAHPNELLTCNDSRFAQFPAILKLAQEAQEKAEKARIQEMKKTRPIQIQTYGNDMLDKCFINTLNTTSKFEVAGLACDLEMRSLQSECQLANNTYNYCKDERFVGYLKQHNILNSTGLP